MDVIVSLKIDIDATVSLSQMESQIQQAGRVAMKETSPKPFGRAKSSSRVAQHVEASRSTPRGRSVASC